MSAFPADIANVAQYIRDIDHLVIKNFPEFRCYRDVAFYFKFFLNPDIKAFPEKANYSQRNAELQTNVAITTQIGELDKLVALLQEQPKGRPTREVRAAQIPMRS